MKVLNLLCSCNIRMSLSGPLYLSSSTLKSSGGMPAREERYRPEAFKLIFHHFLIIAIQHSLSFPPSYNGSFFPLVSSDRWTISPPFLLSITFRTPAAFSNTLLFNKTYLILCPFTARVPSGWGKTRSCFLIYSHQVLLSGLVVGVCFVVTRVTFLLLTCQFCSVSTLPLPIFILSH